MDPRDRHGAGEIRFRGTPVRFGAGRQVLAERAERAERGDGGNGRRGRPGVAHAQRPVVDGEREAALLAVVADGVPDQPGHQPPQQRGVALDRRRGGTDGERAAQAPHLLGVVRRDVGREPVEADRLAAQPPLPVRRSGPGRRRCGTGPLLPVFLPVPLPLGLLEGLPVPVSVRFPLSGPVGPPVRRGRAARRSSRSSAHAPPFVLPPRPRRTSSSDSCDGSTAHGPEGCGEPRISRCPGRGPRGRGRPGPSTRTRETLGRRWSIALPGVCCRRRSSACRTAWGPGTGGNMSIRRSIREIATSRQEHRGVRGPRTGPPGPFPRGGQLREAVSSATRNPRARRLPPSSSTPPSACACCVRRACGRCSADGCPRCAWRP